MKTYDRQSAKNYIIGQVRAGDVLDMETDDNGELLFRTSIYKWSDETLHDTPEPKEEELIEVEITKEETDKE